MVLCVVLCVWCGVWRGLARRKNLRVQIQNVPVCTGTTRTCVTTCARGAGTHGDVLNLHAWRFLGRTHGAVREEGGGRRQFCLPKIAHVGLSLASEVHQNKLLDVTHFQFGREGHRQFC